MLEDKIRVFGLDKTSGLVHYCDLSLESKMKVTKLCLFNSGSKLVFASTNGYKLICYDLLKRKIYKIYKNDYQIEDYNTSINGTGKD
mmetsp:Transcript_34912/g.34583  ORF Transcript_34912/g.34583 Transcript_34912/m.34583 type:complete len:87 (+) Transcript_34912:114-374(+)